MIFKTSRNLINRKQQREKIANLLTQKEDGPKFDVLEFFGIGGLGKSRILEAAKQECRERGLLFAVIDFPPFGKQTTQNPELDFLLRICDHLDKYTDFSLGRLSATSLSRNGHEEDLQKPKSLAIDQGRLAEFRGQLAEALQGKPLILMLDSIEHCPDELFNWLGREFLAPLVGEQGISSVIVFVAGRGPRVAESHWPPALKARTESLRLDPLEFEHSIEHISNLPSEINYRGAAREIYALSNGHSYSTEAIIHWLNSLGVKVEDVGIQRVELARRLREEVIRKYILSDADEWVLPFLEVVCYFRWFTSSYISEFIQKYRPELGKDLPVQWYSARLVDLQKRPLHLVYLDKVHYRLEPTLQKLLHIVTAILEPEEARKIHGEAIEYLERELQRDGTQSQLRLSSDNIAALIVVEILYHKTHLGAITGNRIDARVELIRLLKGNFDPKIPRDLELLGFLRNSLEQDTDLNELLTVPTVKGLVEEIDVFLTPVSTPEQPFKLSHLIIQHIEPTEYQVSWYQANYIVIPIEKVISTQRFLLSEWRNETEEVGKTAFTAYLPERSQEFIRSRSDLAIQLTTNRMDIPWELLHDDHEFLCLSRPMGRRPQSLKESKVLPERKAGPLRALIVGNPTGDLPGAEEEAGLIADALSIAGVETELLVKEKATAKQFARKIRNELYDFIHFAGHAYFEPKAPDMSGLLFCDSPMPAAELGRHLTSSALVFISACEAGMSAVTESHIGMVGDFVSGIAASILFGGAIGCIAPMWGIEDGVAKDLSLSFYKHLLSGKVVGESLRQARLAVRESGSNEGAWKPWVLYGDPTLTIKFVK
jgi:hypothetical protein